MERSSASNSHVTFDLGKAVTEASKAPSSQGEKIKAKVRTSSEGVGRGRTHVRRAALDAGLMSIMAPPKPKPPKPLPRTDAVRQQGLRQKIASEQPPQLTLIQLTRQIRSFVNLDVNQSKKLLATVGQGSSGALSLENLRAFRHCVQGHSTTLSPEIKQQAQEFALAYLKLPKSDRGARTGFDFDPMMTIYSLDIALGKF